MKKLSLFSRYSYFLEQMHCMRNHRLKESEKK